MKNIGSQGLYWKYEKETIDIEDKLIIVGKEAEGNLLQHNEEGICTYGIANTIDQWRKEKFNEDVNQLLDDFLEFHPEEAREIKLTKRKFSTINAYNNYSLRWELSNYIMNMKEEGLKKILDEEGRKKWNFRSIINRSKEVMKWLKEGKMDKYNEFFNAISLINFGQSINIPYYNEATFKFTQINPDTSSRIAVKKDVNKYKEYFKDNRYTGPIITPIMYEIGRIIVECNLNHRDVEKMIRILTGISYVDEWEELWNQARMEFEWNNKIFTCRRSLIEMK
jgi:hypothetical protein